MARLVRKWWKAVCLCAAAAVGLVFAARALDHALLDVRLDPPEVVSVLGSVSDPIAVPGGIALAVESPEDVSLTVVGYGDAPKLGYAILGAYGEKLEEGGGTYIPLDDHPSAAEVEIRSIDPFSASGALPAEGQAETRLGAAADAERESEGLDSVPSHGGVGSADADDGKGGNGGVDLASARVSSLAGSGTPARGSSTGGDAWTGSQLAYSGSENAPYGKNAFSRVVLNGAYTPPVTAVYYAECSSDDTGSILVGPVGASSTLFHPGTGSGILYAGRTYSVSAKWGNIGGPAFINCSVTEGEPVTAYPPHLVVNPKVVRVSLKGAPPATVSVSQSGGNDGKTYSIVCTSMSPGLSYNNGTVSMPDAGALGAMAGRTLSASFKLVGESGVVDTASVVYIVLPESVDGVGGGGRGEGSGGGGGGDNPVTVDPPYGPGDPWDEPAGGGEEPYDEQGEEESGDGQCGRCGKCYEGSESRNGSVSFSQRFGRTPSVPGMPVGRLRIMESVPCARLESPAAFFYDHPMERRIVYEDGYLHAIILSPSGYCTEYSNGVPVNASAGIRGCISRNASGAIVEKLPDGLELTYDAAGGVMALRPPRCAEPFPASGLGISILRDGDGAITNISSTADGNISVSALSTNSFCASWTSPSGAFVKSFTFGRPSENVFTELEWRSSEFNFSCEWTYDAQTQGWTFARSPGTADEVSEVKTVAYDPTNGVWNATVGYRKGAGPLEGVRSETVDVNGAAPMRTGTSVGGQTIFSAQRDQSGRISSKTDSRGLSSSYTYDGWGRMLTRTRLVKGGMVEVVSNSYASAASGTLADRRPSRVSVSLNGVNVHDVGFTYSGGMEGRTRRCGAEERTSFREFDAWGRTTLSVGEDGRAVSTVYSSDPGPDGWTQTSVGGIYDPTNGFSTVDGRSERTVSTYSAAGNLVEIGRQALVGGVWRDISQETRSYNATHRVIATERSDGKASSASWICTGAVWTLGEDGIAVTNSYDGAKRLVSSTRHSPHGAVTTAYVRDARGRAVSETRTAQGLGQLSSSRTYDARGRVLSETDEQGLVTAYAYSPDGLATTVTLPSGGTRITTVNADGSLASVTGTAVTPEYYSYGVTTNGLEWTKVNYLSPDGARWVRTYRNAFGETVREERPGANGSTLVTERAYNGKGQLVSTVSTGQPSETCAYDAWGDLVSVVRSADGTSRTQSMEGANALVDGEVWRVESKALSCSDAAIAPLVATNMTQLSGLSLANESRQVSVDVRGNASETWSEFDPATSTRLTHSTIPTAANAALSESVDGVATLSISHSAVTNSVAYDAYRRAAIRTDGRGNATTNAYDSLGRLASVADATGATTSYAYDSAGRLAAVTNALGVSTVYEYDLRGNKTYEGGGTYPVTYAYDDYNVMTNMTTYRAEGSQSGDTTSWTYDEATGLLLSKTYADGNGPTYTYTPNGNLATRTWARGVVTTYSYDGWNSLTNTAYSDGTPSVTLAYDAMGRQTNAMDAAGMTATAYNDFGDAASETVNGLYSRTVSHVRDGYGRDLGYNIGNSRMSIIEYEADTARMKRVKMAGAWFTYYYLPGTDLKSRLQYGGSGSAYYTYEPNRDLLTQVRNHINGGVISQYDYMNDAAGRRTAITRSGSMMSETRTDYYGYNDRSELVSGTKDTAATNLTEYAYQYDDIGNRLSSLDLGTNRTYIANSLNQYTSISNSALSATPREIFTPTFDLDGNQTMIRTSTGDWQVTYNGENRPVNWACGTTNIVMKFDCMGRRVEYIETVGGTTNAHHRFVYDGYLCIQRLNASSNNAIDLVFGWDPSEPVATRPLVLQKYGQYSMFYTHDGNKNVSELVFFQQSNGIAAHYEYAPFGAVTAASRNTHVTAYDFREYNPFRFSSECNDDMLDLIYYNYRHYDTIYGRWLQKDNLNDSDNKYDFLSNTIYSCYDLLGLKRVVAISNNTSENDEIEWSKIKGIILIKNVKSTYDLFRRLSIESEKDPSDPITQLDLSGHGLSDPRSGIAFNNGRCFDLTNQSELEYICQTLDPHCTIVLWSCNSACTERQKNCLDAVSKKLGICIKAKDGPVGPGPDTGSWWDDFWNNHRTGARKRRWHTFPR